MKNKICELNCAVAIILDRNNRILLQKKDSSYHFGPNKWSFFGGAIEKNEDGQDAILREIREEIGLREKEFNLSFLRNYLFRGSLKNKFFEINHKIFIIKFDGNLSKIRLGEGAGFALFEKEEIKKLELLEPTKIILENYLNDTCL